MKFIQDNVEWLVPSLIALAALVFAIWSAISAHWSKNAATRSADAAEKSARADQEMATLVRADREAAEKAMRQRPWTLVQTAKNRWKATNTGPAAHHVEVEADPILRFEEHDDARERIGQGESFTMLLIRTAGDNGKVLIRWAVSDEPGAERLAQRESI
ncbi:hypothetical protein [Glycomyces tarimensis]